MSNYRSNTSADAAVGIAALALLLLAVAFLVSGWMFMILVGILYSYHVIPATMPFWPCVACGAIVRGLSMGVSTKVRR